MVRLQKPGPPESSRDGRSELAAILADSALARSANSEAGSAANANQGAKIGSDSGFIFSSAFSQRMAPVLQYFPVTQPEILPCEFGQFGRFPAQEQALGCLLAVLLEYLSLLLADEVIPLRLEWLAFRQILRVRFRIGGNAEEGHFVRRDGTGEDTVEGVIIARGNRIVLVVVAASAAHGQRHRSRA